MTINQRVYWIFAQLVRVALFPIVLPVRLYEKYFKRDSKTLESIAEEIYSSLSPRDIAYLRDIERDDCIELHRTVGRHIRNEFSLWSAGCSLTEPWRKDRENGGTKHLINGTDYHPCHPDNISFTILEMVWDRANGKA